MNRGKKKDKNFLPDGAKALLKGIHDIILEYRKKNNLLPSRFATDAGLNKNSLGVLEKEIYTQNGRRSTIDLHTLVKILNQYPQLKIMIGDYLSGNKERNITPVQEVSADEDFKDIVRRLNKCRDEYDRKVKEFEELKKNAPYTTNQP